ncbi:putative transposase [Deinococcus yavapaiensis KR-236]|uniref:Putative transposase n=1 Tax=Deinococcus yavapaiensis KR-236 TaxID=694435 RepID=A0A318S5N1_9DEIO|nr:putative transposase [Deinococcus yavapaiensis KR-236]
MISAGRARSRTYGHWNATKTRFALGWKLFCLSWGKKVEAGTTVVFLDESGFSLKTTVTRTWAVRGQTPLIRSRANWDKLSTIEAITTTGQFLQHTVKGAIKAAKVIAFLRHLLSHVEGNVVIVLDNAGIHKAKGVKDFVAEHARLSLVFMPPYAPELNPIERVWAYVKKHVLGNFCPRNMGELKAKLRSGCKRVRYVELPARLLDALLPLPS